ncbi:MAG: hypothetical protein IKF22_07590 [Lachnospiraceae bacterium]|nr:hypothetical protein [Lachnospiraceae bacterium]
MNHIRKHISFIVLIVFCIIILQPQTVFADKTVDAGKRGSVTIRYFDDVDAKTPVAGAEFTFYKIDDSSDTMTYTDTTNQDGILKINDMKLGRYRVVETSPSPGHKASASFLLTIPMTDHNEWIYDLTLEPKALSELPITFKSVYSVPGSQGAASLLSGRIYSGETAVSGSSTSKASGTGGPGAGASRSGGVSKVMPAGTGDETSVVFWVTANVCAGVTILSILIARLRKAAH